MLSLVYRCSKERVDLVSESYYENELKYEERISSRKNVQHEHAGIQISSTPKKLTLVYPALVHASDAKGVITFFRPDDSKLDFNASVSADDSLSQSISLESFKKGRWRVQVAWNAGEVPFYQEQDIWVN